jgi:hypothetical protein
MLLFVAVTSGSFALPEERRLGCSVLIEQPKVIETSRWSCLTIQFPVHVHFWSLNRPLIDGGAVFHGAS